MSIEEVESTIEMPQNLFELEVDQDWNGRKLQPNGKKLVTHNMSTAITQAQTFIHNQQEPKPTPMGSRVCDHGDLNVHGSVDTEGNKEVGLTVASKSESENESIKVEGSVYQDSSGEVNAETTINYEFKW